MKILKKTLVTLRGIFILSFFLFALFESANANTRPAHTSYKKETADGKYVFVMLAPNRNMDGSGLKVEDREKALALRNQYPTSGLYLINDSSNPLWTVDWYSYEYGTFLSADGNYLIRTGLETSESSNEAISFYETNKLIKTYKISDLLDVAPLLPNQFLFDWESEKFLNAEKNTLTVKTLTYDTVVFDIKNGEEVKSIRPIRFFLFGILGLALAIIFLYLMNRKFKSKKFWELFN